MSRVAVRDARGHLLGTTTSQRAATLVACGRAEFMEERDSGIRLLRVVEIPSAPTAHESSSADHHGQSLLVHICCGPCATWSVRRWRQEGWHVEGFWYNPNVQPFSEHERRLRTLEAWAAAEALPLSRAAGYDMVAFLQQVAGHERYRERCAICYRMRLARTAEEAARRGITAISTTLLISPYQDLEILRAVGKDVAGAYGLTFYGENLRRGYAASRRLAREAGLYMQRHCGCVYSEWEAHVRALSRGAPARDLPRAAGQPEKDPGLADE